MNVVLDAHLYAKLGQNVYEHGWIFYFENGPEREPLYPFLISTSIWLSHAIPLSFLKIQTIFQIILLLSTQILLYRLLTMLEIRLFIKNIIILYFGFSPALVNTGFCLFSEIAALPLILAIILWQTTIWHTLEENTPRNIFHSIVLGLLFILATAVKAIFGLIFAISLLPYIYLAIYSFFQKKSRLSVNAILVICISILTFNIFMIPYKKLNQKFNGQYTYTNRGSWYFYGNTRKRTQPLERKDFVACAAYTMGEKLCYLIFQKERCKKWHFKTVDHFGHTQYSALIKQGLTKQKADKMIISQAIQEIQAHPIQYTFISIIEFFNPFFWESTQMGFVRYPPWLMRLFNIAAFKNILRLCLSFLTIFSVFWGLKDLFMKRHRFLTIPDPSNRPITILFFIFLMLLSFQSLYSLFIILARYITPIVPLYIAIIGYTFDQKIKTIQAKAKTQ